MFVFIIARPIASQLEELITFVIKVLQNNEKLLVAMLLFYVFVTSVITNKNLWRPVSRAELLRPRE